MWLTRTQIHDRRPRIIGDVTERPRVNRRVAAIAGTSALAVAVVVAGFAIHSRSTARTQVAGPTAVEASPKVEAGVGMPQIGVAVGYDPTTKTDILFGGRQYGSDTDLAQTWQWNGSAWAQLHPAHAPPARRCAQVAVDPARAQLILNGGETMGGPSTNQCGGFDSDGRPLLGPTIVSDTWAWTGQDWILLPLTYGFGGSIEGVQVVTATVSHSVLGLAESPTSFHDNASYGCIDPTRFIAVNTLGANVDGETGWILTGSTFDVTGALMATAATDPVTGHAVLFTQADSAPACTHALPPIRVTTTTRDPAAYPMPSSTALPTSTPTPTPTPAPNPNTGATATGRVSAFEWTGTAFAGGPIGTADSAITGASGDPVNRDIVLVDATGKTYTWSHGGTLALAQQNPVPAEAAEPALAVGPDGAAILFGQQTTAAPLGSWTTDRAETTPSAPANPEPPITYRWSGSRWEAVVPVPTTPSPSRVPPATPSPTGSTPPGASASPNGSATPLPSASPAQSSPASPSPSG